MPLRLTTIRFALSSICDHGAADDELLRQVLLPVDTVAQVLAVDLHPQRDPGARPEEGHRPTWLRSFGILAKHLLVGDPPESAVHLRRCRDRDRPFGGRPAGDGLTDADRDRLRNGHCHVVTREGRGRGLAVPGPAWGSWSWTWWADRPRSWQGRDRLRPAVTQLGRGRPGAPIAPEGAANVLAFGIGQPAVILVVTIPIVRGLHRVPR